MKKTVSKVLPLFLACILQVAPLLRTVLMQAREIAPCAWGVVLRIGAGAIGLFGFDAVSSASSIAISPVTATNGVSYIGTITYSGSHAGSVSSMMLSNVCMSSQLSFLQGLKISYAGLNKATVSGIPTNSGTFPFTLKIWDGICSGLTDTRSTSIIIAPTNAALAVPSFTSPPQSVTAQQGAEVLFSAGAYGNPTPTYVWYQGLPSPSTQIGTGSSLSRASVDLTNAGVYSVVASNSQGTATAAAYMTVCQTAGSNQLAFHYTNYFTVSNTIVFRSYITNFSTATNTYKWVYNLGSILQDFSTTGSNYTLAASFVTASHSGIYSVIFNSVLPGGNTIVNQQEYDSYWAFGVPPVITSSPTGVTTNSGNNVTLNVSASVQQNPYGNSLPQGYNWYKNGSPVFSQNITGTNINTSYTIGGATASDSGTYTVVVTNYWGSTTSAPAIVAISSPPT
ncbi:MAG: immunoglobulin domain-containing protein, partial [Limisphaerales bacterium]